MRLVLHVGALAVCAFVPSTTAAQTSKPKEENAALKYYQAFTLLPKMDAERDKILGDRENSNFGPAAVKLIEDCAGSLKLLHRGAKDAGCNWGTDIDGPNTLLPHINKARELSHIALLRARWYFEQGKHRAGLDDVIAVLTLARHLGHEELMISILVQFTIEQQAIDTVARFLPKFDTEVLQLVGKRIEALPPGGSLGGAIMFEREHMVKWQIRQIQDQTYGANAAIEAIVRAAGGPKGPVKQLEELAGRYEEMSQLLALPREQFNVKWAAFSKSLDGNTFAKLLLPAVDKVYDAEDRSKTRWTMFNAARAIVQDGTAKLQEFKDPAGNGPFEYKTIEGGFALKSKLIYKDQPVILVVGPSKAP